MKKSCFLVTYPDGRDSIFDLIDRAREDGFDAVEPFEIKDIWDDSTGIETAKRAKEKLDEYSMECSCFSAGVNMLTTPDIINRLKKSVDVAHALGSPYLHHTMQLSLSFNSLPIYKSVEKTFIEISRQIAEYAGEKGMTCIYEDQGFLFNTPERIGNLISEVGLPNVGVCLDVGNSLFYDVDPEKYAGVFGNIVKHVHVKDYIRKQSCPPAQPGAYLNIHGDTLLPCPIGHGAVDFEKVFTILLENGYDGYFSLEGCAMTDIRRGVKLSLANLQYYYDRAVENTKKNKI